jgi:hypothetical protein
MMIESKEVIELVWMFGPGVAAFFLLGGLLIGIGKDVLKRR